MKKTLPRKLVLNRETLTSLEHVTGRYTNSGLSAQTSLCYGASETLDCNGTPHYKPYCPAPVD